MAVPHGVPQALPSQMKFLDLSSSIDFREVFLPHSPFQECLSEAECSFLLTACDLPALLQLLKAHLPSHELGKASPGSMYQTTSAGQGQVWLACLQKLMLSIALRHPIHLDVLFPPTLKQ